MVVRRNGSPLASGVYAYDAASRLQTASAGRSSATYSYVANSPLVGQIGFTNNGAGRMTTTKQHDFLNRLSALASGGTGSTPSLISFAYADNAANQRTRVTLAMVRTGSTAMMRWAR